MKHITQVIRVYMVSMMFYGLKSTDTSPGLTYPVGHEHVTDTPAHVSDMTKKCPNCFGYFLKPIHS